jgi:ACS family tartrate transporter-like MFS transporter
LTDRPRDAQWLTPAEREWLETTLEAERREVAIAHGEMTLSRALGLRTVWLLALGIFVTNIGGYSLVFWLPTAVRGLLHDTGADASSSAVLDWAGLIYLCGIVGVFIGGRSSDRTGDRKWHCSASLVLAGLFLALSVVPGQPRPAMFSWLCLTGFCAYFWLSPYWALTSQALTASAAAVAIGFVNMCANLAGFVGSPVVGFLKTSGWDDGRCLLVLAGCYALGGVILSFVPVPRRRNGP